MVKNKLRNRGITDDKTMIMERVIGLVADLPHQSRLRENLTNSFLTELWNTLDHPPLLYIGDLYRFRTADGSHNVCFLCFFPHTRITRTRLEWRFPRC